MKQQHALLHFTAATCGMLIVAMLAACAHKPQGGQLRADEVTIDNWKQFESQLRRDLPVGTCLEEIRNYFERLGFEEHQYEIGYGYSRIDNALQAWISEIDRWLLIFYTDVFIWIDLTNDDECLTKMNVELHHIGP